MTPGKEGLGNSQSSSAPLKYVPGRRSYVSRCRVRFGQPEQHPSIRSDIRRGAPMLCGRSDHSDVAIRQECKTFDPLVSTGVRVGRYHSDGCIRGTPNLGNPRRLAHQLYRPALFSPAGNGAG